MSQRPKKVEEANPNQQRLGEEKELKYYGSQMPRKPGDSQTPSYKAPGNHSARPGRVPAYTGNKSAQKLRG